MAFFDLLFNFKTLSLGATSLFLIVMYDYWQKLYFFRNGIPGPFPVPILGNLTSVTKGFTNDFVEKRKKYGKVYGLSIGSCYFVVQDLDMLKEILISQFSTFSNHTLNPFSDPPLNEGISFIKDGHWKEVRNTLSPAFTGGKLKQMTPLIQQCCDQLVENFDKMRGQETGIQCQDMYGAYSMDVIASTVFGMQVDSQKNPDDPFVKNAKAAFDFSIYNPKLLLLVLFPQLEGLYCRLGISAITKPSIKKFFVDVITQGIQLRKEKEMKRVDGLQLMINAHKLDIQEDEDIENGDNKKGSTTRTRAALTTNEIMSNAFLFFLAGYETTNTTLCLCSYLLATHPEIQDKVFDEVAKFAPTKDDVNYEVLSQMEYLDCVIKESLRIYPPSLGTDRGNDKGDIVIKGITIPKGYSVLIPIYAIHHDPEIWDEPEEFRPERFNKENRHKIHPAAWLPFGNGPRICLGMRLALMEVKFALMRMIQEFQFETCSETEIPPVLNIATDFISPPNGVKLQVVPRKKND